MPRAYWISSLETPAATIGQTIASRETVKSTTTGWSSISMARRIVLGIVAHYVIMPGAGWVIAHGLQLEPELAVGVILVGCAPSGTASNVMAFLAKGDVALSVAVASVSTLIAPIVTPP